MKRILFIITITMAASVFANAQSACNGMLDFHLNSLNNYLNSALATPSHMVYDDMQVLMFTPDTYWAGIAIKINCPKSTWPANWMDSFSDNYNKLRGFIETEGKTRLERTSVSAADGTGVRKSQIPRKIPGSHGP